MPRFIIAADMAIVPDAGLVVFLMTYVFAENRIVNSLLEQIGLRFLAGKPYVWDLKEEGGLLGMSVRGLAVRLRLYPSGEWEFFTWDGGIRTPKLVHFQKAATAFCTTGLSAATSSLVPWLPVQYCN